MLNENENGEGNGLLHGRHRNNDFMHLLCLRIRWNERALFVHTSATTGEVGKTSPDIIPDG
jgi:hypothetical protein